MRQLVVVKSPLIKKDMNTEVINFTAKAQCAMGIADGRIYQHEIDGDDDVFMYYCKDKEALIVFRADEVCSVLRQFGKI